MTDYIKREDAIKIINSGISIDTDADKRYVNGLFMAIPSADVAPVRHGHWVDDERYVDGYYANCSECGWQLDVKEEKGYHNYCPNCGARMDGDDDE